MRQRQLLLLSNSRNYGQGYLEHAENLIRDFLGESVQTVLLIPFAVVRMSFDEFASMVGARFQAMGYTLTSVHEADDAVDAVNHAEAIVVAGGNTFQLLKRLYDTNLLDVIRQRVDDGVPYIGWSAGANVACPTIKTTNDMPIVEPPSFRALGLISFQINPHYTDAVIPQHSGETRAERLTEFVLLNPGTYVVGLREGSALRIEGAQVELWGEKSARVFLSGQEPTDYPPGLSLSFLEQGG
ncbi:MAG: dipeptidase PepE [Acidobacteriota bacterium]|nr:dipeptidase PepE [Blastocatellia bacterium]MDW8238874.1 dipeptidase PepE [Acidobacteriota bacterium]